MCNDYCRDEPCKESLKQLGEIASEADDLRAQALYDCCRFDALLEFGIIIIIISLIMIVIITFTCTYM